ncbi:TolB-like translocation protein [Anaeromyxobacter terrae]|uniref:hypothetical protein n=1 Tax=Anaeromyxobacter terrae TaxID=2925406 RepID=UPI001F58A1D9|nr:hypothetical protein [Anaeromyxobacter sp. SG22]
MLTRSHIAGLALALVAPCAAAAAPAGTFTWIAAGPGDQADPAVDGRWVVFTDGSGASRDVLARDLSTGDTHAVAAGPGDEDSPDVARSVVAYRVADGVAVAYLASGELLRTPAEPGAGAPAVSTAAVAWEAGGPGERDIGWFLLGGGAPRGGVIAAPGDQRAPAVSGTSVAYVDDGDGGSVRLQELARGEARVVCEGRATGVALDGGPGALRIAVARAAAGADVDVDVELYDDGGALLAALRLPGEQRRPHLSGDWIALEDLSTGRSRVVLWNWRTGLVHVPRPSLAEQLLGDLSAGDDAVRVAFTERTEGGLDVGLYTLPLPIVDDGGGGGGGGPGPQPARCDDPGAEVLATLALVRAPGAPAAGEIAFSGGGTEDLPIVVCVDARRVSSGWVTLDGEALAGPSQVLSGDAHLEVQAVARGGEGTLAAQVAGKPGASLRIRVLADRGRALPAADGAGPVTPGSDSTQDGGGAPIANGGAVPADAPAGGDVAVPGRAGAGGCASGGAADGLAVLGALALLRLRRRAARA